MKNFILNNARFFTLCAIVAFMSFLVTSCEKDNPIEQSIIEETNESVIVTKFGEPSRALASAVGQLIASDKAWEEAIKARALVSENGDQVFLYAFGKDIEVNGVSLSNALAAHSDRSSTYFSTDILTDFPLISIAYNVPNGKMDIAQSINVNTVYYDFLDDDIYTDDQQMPYFQNGESKTKTYGETSKANDAYLVIKNNERIVLVNKTNGSIINDNYFERNYLSNPVFKAFFYSDEALIGTLGNVEYRLNAEIGGLYSEELGDETSLRCFRDNWPHVRDGSTAVKYSDDREGWLRGGPEIRQRMNRVESSGNLTPFSNGRNYDKNTENQVMTFNYNAFLLQSSIHGNDYGWAWWEEDGGSGDDRFNGSFSATVPGLGNIGLNYDFAKNKDDNYGNMEVSYCMGAQWIYMGDIEWWGGPTWW